MVWEYPCQRFLVGFGRSCFVTYHLKNNFITSSSSKVFNSSSSIFLDWSLLCSVSISSASTTVHDFTPWYIITESFQKQLMFVFSLFNSFLVIINNKERRNQRSSVVLIITIWNCFDHNHFVYKFYTGTIHFVKHLLDLFLQFFFDSSLSLVITDVFTHL